ncbi:MAG: hypothetical protein KAI24_01430, partial [Planctomycetes bacterium]|nr:hypothetical protein [Planctomycetota bacterium]
GALGIGIDRRNDVVWTNGTSGGGRELVALDAAIGSPTYGTVLAATTGLSLQMTSSTWKWRLSPSGRIAAVVDGILPAPRLWIVDTDPTSASFLSCSDAGLIPVAPGSFYVSADDCVITPGDEQVVVTLEHGLSSVTEIARYDVAAGAWIDHDPSTPAIDAIGPNSLPAVTPLSIFTDIDVSPDGGVVAFAGLGAGVARLLIDPRSGAFWDYAFFAASGSESNTWACAVSPDGAQVAFTSWAGGATSPGPAKVTILDTFTGAVVGSAALGTATNIYTCVWR